MVVTRFMDGRELTQADMQSIKLTDNPDISRMLDRVVARVNEDSVGQTMSDKDVPA